MESSGSSEMPETRNVPMACFICLQESPPPIRTGCACRGSAGVAHPECLRDSATFQEQHRPHAWTKCQTCNHDYTGELQIALTQAWVSEATNRQDADKLAAESARLGALVQTGQAEAALDPLRTLYGRCVLEFGESHPDTCTVGGNLAVALVRQEKLSEAESLQLKLLLVVRRMLGPNHLETMRHEHTLAMILSKQRRYSEAEDIQRRVWRTYADALGEEDTRTLNVASTLATTLAYQLKLADAATLQRLVLQAQQRLLGLEHPNTLLSAANLGSTLLHLGAWDEAEQLLQPVLESYEKLRPHIAQRNMELASHTLKVAQEMKARLFPTGTRVRVRGLVAKPEYNSKTARVVAFDARSSRYRVVLDDGKQLLVKAACLERDV